MSSCVLVTGGAGFIGSHTCLVLLEKGYELVILDNFENSSPEALKRVCELTGSHKIELVEGDVRNQTDVDLALKKAGQCVGVIHFAGKRRADRRDGLERRIGAGDRGRRRAAWGGRGRLVLFGPLRVAHALYARETRDTQAPAF